MISTATIIPLDHCERLDIPVWVFKIVWQRQNGLCADCALDLLKVRYHKDHDPALGLRPSYADANDPKRIRLRCLQCHDDKTYGDDSPRSGDRKQIDHARRASNKHAEHLTRMGEKYPGRARQKKGTIKGRGFERRQT